MNSKQLKAYQAKIFSMKAYSLLNCLSDPKKKVRLCRKVIF